MQRPDLKAADVNLPFYASIACSVVFSIAGAVASGRIADAMGVPNLAPYLIAALAICPFLTLSGFQEAMYRRNLQFRPLAVRTLVGIAAGGIVGVGMAFAGLGTWSLIGQFAVQTLISVAWLWLRPVWTPTTTIVPESGRQLGRFGANIIAFRLLDFVTTRSVDFLILLVYGPNALGLFAVSSRLYQLLLQLLQASVSSVGLAMLSKVADDHDKLRRLFLRSTSLCAVFGTPVFFGLAALAPEVNRIMFGVHWAGAEAVMTPLLLIGGIYCIQFIFGSYLTAVGRPHLIFVLVAFKAAVVLPPLYFIHLPTVAATATLYAVALLLETPLAVYVTLKALALPWASIVRPVVVPILAASFAFAVTVAARDLLPSFLPFGILTIIEFGVIFALCYLVAIVVTARQVALDNVAFLRGALRR